MRAHTVYEAIEHDQPGTPVRIHTYPHREDLAAMCADIRAAKQQADVVAVSHHWGIHFVPYVLADYQPDVARAAIDAGADIVLGHHAHILKAVEIYKGKPIFYSLCNFATDLRMDEAHANSKGFREIQKLAPRWEPDFDSLYNFPEDSRMTVMVRAKTRSQRRAPGRHSAHLDWPRLGADATLTGRPALHTSAGLSARLLPRNRS